MLAPASTLSLSDKIEKVIEGVHANRDDIVKLLDEYNIHTPEQCSETENDKHQRGLVIITDLEPDDVLAILMMRQRRRGHVPVVIHIADLDWKDKGGILAKKIVMAATALGRGYAQRLVVLNADRHEDEMRKARTQLKQLKQSSGLDPEWVFIAPGRGKLEGLMKDFGKAPCHVYSGSFNTRLPQMSQADIEAIVKVAEPMHDSAHFIFTKNYAGLASLRSLWPTLGEDITVWNPAFGEAWHQFAQEFDAMLINPGHPSLFLRPSDLPKDADPLTPEERAHFKEKVAPLFGDPSKPGANTAEYAKALVNAEYFNKLTGFKKPTAVALAQDLRDGPLCDMLVPISDWLRNEGKQILQDVEVKSGKWLLDPEKGFTKILPADATEAGAEAGLCEGTMVALRDPATDMVEIKKELLKAIKEMTEIHIQSHRHPSMVPMLPAPTAAPILPGGVKEKGAVDAAPPGHPTLLATSFSSASKAKRDDRVS